MTDQLKNEYFFRMMTREQALELIREHVPNENIIKHMVALEAVMGALFDAFKDRGKTDAELVGSRDEWKLAGLMHDGDYCDEVPPERQGIQIALWAERKGFEVSPPVHHAMAAHNWSHTGVAPENLMDWSIFCADSLTGLVVASALILPTKKLADLKVESVLKRFKSPSFAAGTRRDDIGQCEEKLGIQLDEFAALALTVMQGIGGELGL